LRKTIWLVELKLLNKVAINVTNALFFQLIQLAGKCNHILLVQTMRV